jgi:zinc/manganese transport system permease protein
MLIATMFDYDFMRTAFAAGTIAAIVAGSVGYFLVMRNLVFAGHALSHVGFAGATGAVLIGISPFWFARAYGRCGNRHGPSRGGLARP